MPSRLTFDSDSEYSEIVRIYCKNECNAYWKAYRLPVERDRLADLVRTTIAQEMRRGVFRLGTIPKPSTVARRISELADSKRYPTGATGLVCIGQTTIAGVTGSYYIPQPLEWTGEDRQLLEQRLPERPNQETLM